MRTHRSRRHRASHRHVWYERCLGYAGSMFLTEAAAGVHPWHFWLAAVLAPTTVIAIIAMVAGYFFKVTRQRYPRGGAE